MIYVQTWEEGRVERVVAHLAKTFYEKPSTLGIWTIVDGLREDGRVISDTKDPVKALAAIIAGSAPGFYLMKDLPTAIGDHGAPELTRLLRDAYRALKDKGRFLFLVSPQLFIPEDAKKEIFYLEYELPDEVEISKILDAVLKARLDNGGISDVDRKRLAPGAQGAHGRRDRPSPEQGVRDPPFVRGDARTRRSWPRRSRCRRRTASSSSSLRASRSKTWAATRT